LKLDRLRLALEMDDGSAFQDHDPFVFFLVIPEPLGRALPLGDNPLNTKAAVTVNLRELLLGKPVGDAFK
jgi:hypothetical protein